VRKEILLLKLLVFAFSWTALFWMRNCECGMMYLYGKFSPELGLKYQAFFTKKSQNIALAHKKQTPRTMHQEHVSGGLGARRLHSCAKCLCVEFMCAWRPILCVGCMGVSSGAENVCFFTFLGVCFYVKCLGTWKHNSSLCNIFRDLLNFHFFSFQGLHKSSDVLLCRYAWFLRKLQQNILQLLCFEKNIVTLALNYFIYLIIWLSLESF